MRTSLYSILCIAIRLGAILLAWTLLSKVPSVLGLSNIEGFTFEDWAVSITFVVAGLVVAFLIWLFPGPLARLAAGRSSEQIFESPISASEIQWIAFSVLGMYFAFSGLTGLTYVGMQIATLDQYREFADAHLIRARRIDIAFYFVDFVLGVALVFGSKGLTNVLHRMRYSGTSGLTDSGTPDRQHSAD